jgi:large subunit ribosomal protein L17
MRHRVKKTRLSRAKGPRTLLIKNLANSVILHGKIETTKAKAKAVQPIIEKLINAAKGEDKRQALIEVKKILKDDTTRKLFDELSKKYQDRPSGFTRISDTGFRSGDCAPMAQIELI